MFKCSIYEICVTQLCYILGMCSIPVCNVSFATELAQVKNPFSPLNILDMKNTSPRPRFSILDASKKISSTDSFTVAHGRIVAGVVAEHR